MSIDELTFVQASELVQRDFLPRVFVETFYNNHKDYRVAYWGGTLGVLRSGIYDSYQQAEDVLKTNDWEDDARLRLEYELRDLSAKAYELAQELQEIESKIGRIQASLR